MSIGNTFNQTSLDIANARYKARLRSPSVIQRDKWHKEFLESGAQYKMAFATFLKEKTELWHKEKNQKKAKKSGKAPSLKDAPRSKFGEIKPRSLWQDIGTETAFISGKHKFSDIGTVYKSDPEYFIWVLENQPTSIVAQQIVNYFNKNPNTI